MFRISNGVLPKVYFDVSESNNIEKTFTLIEVVRISLVAAHSKFPEAVNNEVYRTIVKKNLMQYLWGLP